MIFLLATAGYRNMMREYLDSWGRALSGTILPLTYEDVFHCRSLPTGTFVFADVDRLEPSDARRAANVWEALADAGQRVLNHPLRAMQRYELLRTLHQRGSNRFNVYRVRDDDRPRRFPVFVRDEHDHRGGLTPLLPDVAALEAALRDLRNRGHRPDDLLITEFCDTADRHGISRKYSVFALGDRIIAGHVFFGDSWLLKVPQLLHPELIAEEYAYIRTNPHEAALRAVLQLARIDYGRIDYAMLDGQPQIWEINTNPWLMSFRDVGTEVRMPQRESVAAALHAAFLELAASAPRTRVPIPLQAGPFERWRRPWPVHVTRALLRRTGLLWYEERLRTSLQRLRGRQPVAPATAPKR